MTDETPPPTDEELAAMLTHAMEGREVLSGRGIDVSSFDDVGRLVAEVRRLRAIVSNDAEPSGSKRIGILDEVKRLRARQAQSQIDREQARIIVHGERDQLRRLRSDEWLARAAEGFGLEGFPPT
jgi:hypothetical protein